MRCETCLSGYTDTVYPVTGSSASNDPSECDACPSDCLTCTHNAGTGAVQCVTCTDTTTDYLDTQNTDASCETKSTNCDVQTGSDGTCGTCVDGYKPNGAACDQCTPSNCKTCATSTADCEECISGYGLVDSDFNNDTSDGMICESCSISKCLKCFTWGGYSGAGKQCVKCETGYVPYDSSEGPKKAVWGGACKKCPTGCNVCTVDYSTSNDATVCSSGSCASWDGSRAYVNNDDGGCAQCPSKCQSCSYDSSTQATVCDDNQCDGEYAKNANSGECEACPDNCNACEWDSTTSSIICTDGQCDTKYGKISDGTCSSCPGNCDVCSVSDASDADDTLFCDTCTDTYGLNTDVCAKCPSNCEECNDVSGTMTCTACKDGYALDSSASCTKCPTNCEECTATGSLLCSDCRSGYALAGDRLSCIACSTAAFENCATCGDVNATTDKAECESCNVGYTLEDEEEDLSCVSTSTLSCLNGQQVDNGLECTSCAEGYITTDDFECAIMCYKCGDLEAGTTVPQAECQIPSAGSNATTGMATLEECTIGACYASYQGNGNVMSGCMPSSFNGGVCSGAYVDGEFCQTANGASLCEQCCVTDSCNTFVSTMDGLNDSGAAFMAVNVFLLAVAAFFSIC